MSVGNKIGNSYLYIIIFMTFAMALSAPAFATLQAMGAVDNVDKIGFPLWYQDTNNIALDLMEGNNANILPSDAFSISDPAADGTTFDLDGNPIPFNQFSVDIGFNAEGFYWSAEADVAQNGITALVVNALEAAFAGESAVDGEQSVFGRVRFKLDVPVAGTYTVRHPYGTETFIVPSVGPGPEIQNAGIGGGEPDIGCFGTLAPAFSCDPNSPNGSPDPRFNFANALQSGIGPFLTWDTFNINPALSDGALVNAGNPGRRYVGDGATPHLVTGSPVGQNFFEVVGPGGITARTELFTVSGRLFAGPSIVNVSSTNADGTYGIGATIPITVMFSAPVVVNTAGGTPSLALNSAVGRVATFASGSGTATLTFNYVVQAGDSAADLNYTSTTALALNGGTITDTVLTTAGAILTLPNGANSLGFNKNIVIDGVAPTAGPITSNANVVGALKIGDTITFTVTPTAAEPGGSAAGSYNGVALAWATADAGVTYTATYTVANGNADQAVPLQVTGVILSDAVGNPSAALLGTDVAKTIDANAPAVTSVSSPNLDGIYAIGAGFNVTVTFNEAVAVTGAPTLGLATGVIGGVPNGTATFLSGSGTNTLLFSYTVQPNDGSSDLEATTLSLNGGTISDVAGNTATLTLPAPGAAGSLGANKALVIDGIGPTLTGSNPANNAKVQTLTTVTLTLQQPVGVDTAATTITATKDGLAFTDFTRINGANNPATTITLTIIAPADGAYVFSITPRSISGLTGSLSTVTITDDSVSPTVTGVSAANADGAYRAGQNIDITVTFNEAVAVTGAPTIALATVPARTAAFLSGSGTSVLAFTYTVQAGDNATDLDYTATNALSLNGGTINDIAGNIGVLTLAAPGAAGSLGATKNIVVDTVAPAITVAPTATATHDTATITWTTDDPATHIVFYGTTTNTTSNVTDAALAAAHSVAVTGLTASTLYFFNASSCDAAGNCVTSAQANFTTTAAPAPAPAPSGGGGGGGGGGGISVSAAGASSSAAPAGNSKSFLWDVIPALSPLTIEVESDDIAVDEVELRLQNQVSGAFMRVTALSSAPQSVPALDNVFQYVEIEHEDIEESNIGTTFIRFSVDKSWIESNDIDKTTLAIQRYKDGWNELLSRIIKEDANKVYLEAQTPGFSTFAITGEKNVLSLPEATPVVSTPEPTVEQPIEQAITGQVPASPGPAAEIVVIILLLGVAGFLGWKYMDKIKGTTRR